MKKYKSDRSRHRDKPGNYEGRRSKEFIKRMKLPSQHHGDEEPDDYWVAVITQLRRDFGCFYLGQPLSQHKFAEIMGCGIASVVRWLKPDRRPQKHFRVLFRFLVYNRDLQERWWNATCNYNETTDWREAMMQKHKSVHSEMEPLVENEEEV